MEIRVVGSHFPDWDRMDRPDEMQFSGRFSVPSKIHPAETAYRVRLELVAAKTPRRTAADVRRVIAAYARAAASTLRRRGARIRTRPILPKVGSYFGHRGVDPRWPTSMSVLITFT